MGRRDWTAPSGDLDGQSKARYRHTKAQLIEQGLWNDLATTTLELYVRQLERARKHRAFVSDDGTARGSQGQLVEHPALKTIREAERDAHKYATALLLTPASRKAEADKKGGDTFGGAFG